MNLQAIIQDVVEFTTAACTLMGAVCMVVMLLILGVGAIDVIVNRLKLMGAICDYFLNRKAFKQWRSEGKPPCPHCNYHPSSATDAFNHAAKCWPQKGGKP